MEQQSSTGFQPVSGRDLVGTKIIKILAIQIEGIAQRKNSGVRSSGAENLGAWRRFSQGDVGPGFSDKDLARVFCNSCNS
jgi:hypothetical protein